MPGKVLYFAGENPDDVRMRWIAMSEHIGFDINAIDVHFVEGVVDLKELEDRIRAEAEVLGGLTLIIIDTSAAYFLGDDENNNAAMGAYARHLRRFTTVQGGPTVITNCHPVKNAKPDNLLPRGGGAFLAEVDGNLTSTANDMLVQLSWQGKFRGPDFDPMSFELRSLTAERLKDGRGRSIYTVLAAQLTETEMSSRSSTGRTNEDNILIFVADCETPPSVRSIAEAVGFLSPNGKPITSKTKRILDKLKADKLISPDRGEYVLTDKGKEHAKRAKRNPQMAGATYG